ncbi:DUF2982 domain-containing protein [Thalassotalea aquiviva]|uniref:DUF2982 domain-containing protein n=1 Tax=Thalassotalea aquiviva TaxID=3242415 RepID=UPI00352B0B50
MLISLTLAQFLWDPFKLPMMVLLLASFVVFFIGILKFLEPATSYQLTKETLSYRHRAGKWQLSWQNIVRIALPIADVSGQRTTLPYVGIKLRDVSYMATNITPRLANKLIHEQQPLVQLAVQNGFITLEQGMINFSPYVRGRQTFKGPIAAWLHRAEILAQAYGFHLFLPEDSFDRTRGEFLALLNQCKEHVNRHPPPRSSRGI